MRSGKLLAPKNGVKGTLRGRRRKDGARPMTVSAGWSSTACEGAAACGITQTRMEKAAAALPEPRHRYGNCCAQLRALTAAVTAVFAAATTIPSPIFFVLAAAVLGTFENQLVEVDGLFVVHLAADVKFASRVHQ